LTRPGTITIPPPWPRLFTEDAVLVANTGPVYGREAIEKWYADGFKQFHFSNHLGTADQYFPHSIDVRLAMRDIIPENGV
jgi:hypothetical protein